MAVRSTCPYDPECASPCSADDVGRVLELTVEPRRRHLLAVLEDLAGDWVSVEDFLVHLRSLSPEPDAAPARAALDGEELPRLEALGLAEYDAADGRFRYHGCPLVADVVAMVTR